jgi:hypothetical protein
MAIRKREKGSEDMNKKQAIKWIFSGLAAAMVIISGVPLSEVFADHGERHLEQWERGSKDKHFHFYKDVHEDRKDWEDAEWEDKGAYFTDGETVILSFPEEEDIRVEAVIRVNNGQLFIPAQTVFDACRIPYILYPKGDILEGFANGKQFIFHADKKVMYLGGQKISMGMNAFTTSDRFYVPLKAAAKLLGYTVKADPKNKMITFRGGEKSWPEINGRNGSSVFPVWRRLPVFYI